MRTWDFEHACYTGERTLHVPLTHVRSNSHRGSLAVATDDGKVGMVDLRQSVSLFATASAHPGGVNEISIAGDSLATCGFRAGCARYSLPLLSFLILWQWVTLIVVLVSGHRATLRPSLERCRRWASALLGQLLVSQG